MALSADHDDEQAGPPLPLRVGGPALLALAVAALLLGGTVRAVRGGGWDLAYFRAAGFAWLDAGNPYDPAAFDPQFRRLLGDADEPGGQRLHNPPTFLPLIALLAAAGPHGARFGLALLNTLGALAIAWCVSRWVREHWAADGRSPGSAEVLAARTIVPAVTLCLYAVHQLIVAGQISLAVAGLMFLAWPAALHNRAWAGAALAVVGVKPQYVLLPVLWLALERRWRTLAVCAAGTAILFVPAAVRPGPVVAVRGWLAALAGYERFSYNALGDIHTLGLPSVAAFAGLPVPPALWLTILGSMAVVAVWWRLRPAGPLETLAVLVPAQMLLVYGKQLEIWMFAPMLAFLWTCSPRPSALTTTVALVALATLIVPNGILTRLGVPLWTTHGRTLVLAAGFAFAICCLAARRAAPPEVVPVDSQRRALGPRSRRLWLNMLGGRR